MKLQEFQLKYFFKQYGIPIPEGHVTANACEAKQIAEEIGTPVVVKAQVLTEGRGMAGGIRLAKTSQEAKEAASDLLSAKINGLPVHQVLIDEALSIEKEYFILITINRATKRPVILMYDSGNIYIEAAANGLFDNLQQIDIDPIEGLQNFQIRDLAERFNFPQVYIRKLISICMAMWKIYNEMDPRLIAVNPLAITRDQRLLALDGKLTIDDNALYRQNIFWEMQNFDFSTAGEIEAQKYGIYYIKTDGDIGCLVNGAGLSMMTMDCIHQKGGRAADFLDLGSDVDEKKVEYALNVIYKDPQVKVLIINIYGGMTHCDIVADGLLAFFGKNKFSFPVIIYFGGTHSEAGIRKMMGSTAIIASSFDEAITLAIEIESGLR